MNDNDLRDCFAMFAMNGLISRSQTEFLLGESLCKAAYEYADAMLEARKPKEKENEEDTGIAAVVPKRTRKR